LWSCGFFAASSGNVTDEVIAQDIEQHAIEEQIRDEDFTIEP
jgi:putative transposase